MVKYFTPEEVARHNCREDCWVSIFYNVFDITDLIAQNPGELALPLLKSAGTSISHWFLKDTGDLKTYIDPEKNIRLPYTPGGRFIDVPPPLPRVLSVNKEKPWWLDQKYMVGKVNSYVIRSYFSYLLPNS
jgi:cytochrome b involved in lipid metabolism